MSTTASQLGAITTAPRPRTQLLAMARTRATAHAGLLLIVAVAAALRFYGLDREGFWGDEYLQLSTYHTSAFYTALYALRDHALGPLDFLIGRLMYHVDPSVWMCRMPSALWGIVGVALIYFVARQLATWREGLMAAGLLCVCPMHIAFSQEMRPYSICAVFLLGMLWALLRAFDRPTYGRVAVYGLIAYLSTLTRSLTPVVFVFVIGMVLTGSWIVMRRSGRPWSDDTRCAVRRLWVATSAVGVAAGAMIVLMIHWTQLTVFSGSHYPNTYDIDTRLHAKLLSYMGVMGRTLMASYGPLVLALACLGVIWIFRHWRTVSVKTRCVVLTMVLVGPTYVLIYAMTLETIVLQSRYNFYLMPIVAVLAAFGCTAIGRWVLPDHRAGTARRRVAVGAWGAVVLAFPSMTTAYELVTYHNPDWRGCADYLRDKVTPEDVIMVLDERPFGQPQARFYGKYEWRPWQCGGDPPRPLAEAMWTLASVPYQFERLKLKPGRCYLVMSYPIDHQRRDTYRSLGLLRPLPGYHLEKFRALDLLHHESWDGDLIDELLAVCDDVLALSRPHTTTNAIPLALKACLLIHSGRIDEGMQVYRLAEAAVQPSQRAYFRANTQWFLPTGPP